MGSEKVTVGPNCPLKKTAQGVTSECACKKQNHDTILPQKQNHDKLLQNIQVLTLHFSRYTITFNLEYG